MSDRATANLPSSDFGRTFVFYSALGFAPTFRDEEWMILARDALVVEFVRVDTDPAASIASCCFRVDDLDELYADFLAADLSSADGAIPRLTAQQEQPSGMRMFFLIDPDGSLIRCIENPLPGEV